MFTVSFLNLKGGVGKTTSAVNLSAAAACRGLHVLLVDLDPQGSATDHFLDAVETPNVADVMDGAASLRDAATRVASVLGGNATFFIVPSGEFRLNASEIALQAKGSKKRLRAALDVQRRSGEAPDFVALDTGPGLGFLWYNALYASDVVICPVELQMAALQGLRRFHELVAFAREEDGLNPPVFYLPTNNDGRLRESRELLAVLLDEYGAYPDGQTLPAIRYSSALSKAYGQRQTIFDFDPRDQAAADCLTLIDVILSLEP